MNMVNRRIRLKVLKVQGLGQVEQVGKDSSEMI